MTTQSILYIGAVVKKADAKASGLSRYFTGRACINGHLSQRQVSNGNCVACVAESWERFAIDNPFARMDARDKYRKSEKGRAAHNKANRRYRFNLTNDDLIL